MKTCERIYAVASVVMSMTVVGELLFKCSLPLSILHLLDTGGRVEAILPSPTPLPSCLVDSCITRQSLESCPGELLQLAPVIS